MDFLKISLFESFLRRDSVPLKQHVVQGGPLPVLNGPVTPRSRVSYILRTSPLFSVTSRGFNYPIDNWIRGPPCRNWFSVFSPTIRVVALKIPCQLWREMLKDRTRREIGRKQIHAPRRSWCISGVGHPRKKTKSSDSGFDRITVY